VVVLVVVSGLARPAAAAAATAVAAAALILIEKQSNMQCAANQMPVYLPHEAMHCAGACDTPTQRSASWANDETKVATSYTSACLQACRPAAVVMLSHMHITHDAGLPMRKPVLISFVHHAFRLRQQDLLHQQHQPRRKQPAGRSMPKNIT
jgi:hypothetical protein